jgi:hypothetical protein
VSYVARVSGLSIIDTHFVFLELLFKQKQPHSNSNDKKNKKIKKNSI